MQRLFDCSTFGFPCCAASLATFSRCSFDSFSCFCNNPTLLNCLLHNRQIGMPSAVTVVKGLSTAVLLLSLLESLGPSSPTSLMPRLRITPVGTSVGLFVALAALSLGFSSSTSCATSRCTVPHFWISFWVRLVNFGFVEPTFTGFNAIVMGFFLPWSSVCSPVTALSCCAVELPSVGGAREGSGGSHG